jgi:hypothetical protein
VLQDIATTVRGGGGTPKASIGVVSTSDAIARYVVHGLVPCAQTGETDGNDGYGEEGETDGNDGYGEEDEEEDEEDEEDEDDEDGATNGPRIPWLSGVRFHCHITKRLHIAWIRRKVGGPEEHIISKVVKEHAQLGLDIAIAKLQENSRIGKAPLRKHVKAVLRQRNIY